MFLANPSQGITFSSKCFKSRQSLVALLRILLLAGLPRYRSIVIGSARQQTIPRPRAGRRVVLIGLAQQLFHALDLARSEVA